jgi:hypothetical protein
MIASIGEKVIEDKSSQLKNSINYPGLYSITFQKGVAAWWCGLIQESRDTFLQLLHEEKEIDSVFIEPCLSNLNIMKTKPFINYNKQKHNLKIKFNNYDIIDENYSEAFQDLFVLTILNGKTDGTYLEIGAGDPIYGNNTFLLEKKFNWKGISLDINENITAHYNTQRENKCFPKDATSINYPQFLSGLGYKETIDYLQIDCDPPETTYNILLSLPLDSYRFAIITYEHDYYLDQTKSFQEKSTKYLESYGYIKVINNIAPDNHRNYEDWWVHPELVSIEQYQNLIQVNNAIKNSQYIFLQE